VEDNTPAKRQRLAARAQIYWVTDHGSKHPCCLAAVFGRGLIGNHSCELSTNLYHIRQWRCPHCRLSNKLVRTARDVPGCTGNIIYDKLMEKYMTTIRKVRKAVLRLQVWEPDFFPHQAVPSEMLDRASTNRSVQYAIRKRPCKLALSHFVFRPGRKTRPLLKIISICRLNSSKTLRERGKTVGIGKSLEICWPKSGATSFTRQQAPSCLASCRDGAARDIIGAMNLWRLPAS